jgi:regulator of protease activity HflC (stomatin/prohibitin superfamily)
MDALIWVILAAIVIFVASIKTVKEGERLVRFRLGRFLNIAGPGLVLLIPVIDKGVRVDLREGIPEWRALPKEELNEKIKAFVLEQGGGPR